MIAFTPGAGPQATKATKDFFDRDKTYAKPTSNVAAAGKAKSFLGMEYGHHQIKDVPAAQLASFAL